MEAVVEIARRHGVATHLDGARLWNALVESDWSLETIGRLFDTVSVCLSKGLGAPIGSVVVGGADRIEIAHKFRKVWGGGWRQAGLLAAAGLHALDHHVERLRDDHANARAFYDEIGTAIDREHVPPPETNIVVIPVPPDRQGDILAQLQERDVLVSGAIPGAIRAVFHLDVSAEQAKEAGQSVGAVLENAKNQTGAAEGLQA
jgi:threonine aldolase